MNHQEFKKKRCFLWQTQAEAAAALGVSQMTISRWESGARRVSKTAIKLLERILEERELRAEKAEKAGETGKRLEIPETMKAMVLEAPHTPLKYLEMPVPTPGPEQVLLRVRACGVCRTDLHIVDGELTEPRLPLILGHEIVGTVAAVGEKVQKFRVGDRLGVPWLGYTCGQCPYCRRGRENLCDSPKFTGYTLNGGYAPYTVADQRYSFLLPEGYPDAEAAPLLCAGLIGYRSYRLAGDEVERLGIYGFGAAAHITIQVAVHRRQKVYAFTRPGDTGTQEFARRLGAVWDGDSSQLPPETLDAAIIFAPVGDLVPAALRATGKGGVVVCGGIHMSDIPAFSYDLLWGERVVRSVANLTRRDGEEFLALAPRVPIRTEVQTFPLPAANEALNRLRAGQITGAAVLLVEEDF
jgi:propanol-preferring alcohol dehydrogenase